MVLLTFLDFLIHSTISDSGLSCSCQIKNSGLSKMMSLLSFTPVSRPVILDKASALPIDLPGLCTKEKEYLANCYELEFLISFSFSFHFLLYFPHKEAARYDSN